MHKPEYPQSHLTPAFGVAYISSTSGYDLNQPRQPTIAGKLGDRRPVDHCIVPTLAQVSHLGCHTE